MRELMIARLNELIDSGNMYEIGVDPEFRHIESIDDMAKLDDNKLLDYYSQVASQFDMWGEL